MQRKKICEEILASEISYVSGLFKLNEVSDERLEVLVPPYSSGVCSAITCLRFIFQLFVQPMLQREKELKLKQHNQCLQVLSQITVFHKA